MAFQEYTPTGSGEEFKFDTKGKSLTGIYLGSFDHDGKFGPTKKHLFKTESGVKVVFGQAFLMTELPAIPDGVGKLMRLTYTADKPGKKGNPMKVFKIAIDNEFQADQETIESAVDAANSEEPTDYPDDGDEVPADEIQTPPAKPRPAAQAPSKSAQSRVQDLLAKTRRAG